MQIDIILVFFIYGLAFFTMGIVLLLESSRSPILASTRALLLLAAFGLLHGSHEWLELVLVYSGWFSPTLPIWIGWMRIVLLTIARWAAGSSEPGGGAMSAAAWGVGPTNQSAAEPLGRYLPINCRRMLKFVGGTAALSIASGGRGS